jgi:hypothetical protein
MLPESKALGESNKYVNMQKPRSNEVTVGAKSFERCSDIELRPLIHIHSAQLMHHQQKYNIL